MGSSSISGALHLAWKVENRENYYPRLYRPYGITVFNSEVVVAEGFWPYSRIQIFDGKSGRSLRTSEQGCILPHNVAVTSEDVIAVTDHRDRTVKFLSTNDCRVIGSWQEAIFEWPTGIAIDVTGSIYVADWSLGLVHVLDMEGRTLSSFTSAVASNTSHPVDIAVDGHHRVVVSDARDHSVNIFDPAGRLLSRTHDSCQSLDPRGVSIDNGGNIVVSDWGAGVIRQFCWDGRWIADLLGKNEGLSHPWGIAVSNSSAVAVTEQKLSEKPAVKFFVPG